MVSITKKQVGGYTYFYLGHTYRSEGKLKKIEKQTGHAVDWIKVKKVGTGAGNVFVDAIVHGVAEGEIQFKDGG